MRKFIIITIVFITLGLLGFFLFRKSNPTSQSAAPTPTPLPQVEQLSTEDQPQVSLKFSTDAHYVTVNISNIHADQLEYNLIYEATVKSESIQTGVNASSRMEGKTEYSKQQLLGSESSGKFTYHTNIQDAILELTLRDSSNRSVFTATYPFEVSAGQTIDLSPSL